MKLRSGRIINSNLDNRHNKRNYKTKSCISELITFSIISCSIIFFSMITHQQGLWNNMQDIFEENIEYYNDTINTINPFSIMNITSQELIPRSLFSNLF